MEDNEWLSSKGSKTLGKFKDCDLMHHRLSGKVNFKKQGNAYFYSKDDVIKLRDGSSK